MCPALVPVKNQDRHTERRREEAKLLAAERAAGAVHEQAERDSKRLPMNYNEDAWTTVSLRRVITVVVSSY